jgi:DNA gyrase subunit A
MAIRFEESDARPMGRSAYGVKGITLEEGDEVVSAETIRPPTPGEPPPAVLTVTTNGYGKRSELAEYRVQSRGGKGIITIKTTERNGSVVSALAVFDPEEVMIITNRGMLIRMAVKGISVIGRNTQGVRLITLESKEEKVVSVARVAETGQAAEAAGVREEAAELAAPVETEPEKEPEDGDAGDEGGGGGEGPEEAR